MAEVFNVVLVVFLGRCARGLDFVVFAVELGKTGLQVFFLRFVGF